MSKSPRNPSKPIDFIGQYNNWVKVHSRRWSCWSTGGNKNMLMRIQHDAEIITKIYGFISDGIEGEDIVIVIHIVAVLFLGVSYSWADRSLSPPIWDGYVTVFPSAGVTRNIRLHKFPLHLIDVYWKLWPPEMPPHIQKIYKFNNYIIIIIN